jgi:hypothetical protein
LDQEVQAKRSDDEPTHLLLIHQTPMSVGDSHHLKTPNVGLQLRRAISINPRSKKLFEKHAVAPSAARLCSAAR